MISIEENNDEPRSSIQQLWYEWMNEWMNDIGSTQLFTLASRNMIHEFNIILEDRILLS